MTENETNNNIAVSDKDGDNCKKNTENITDTPDNIKENNSLDEQNNVSDATFEPEEGALPSGKGVFADKKAVVFAVAALIIIALSLANNGFSLKTAGYGIVAVFTAWFSVMDINARVISNRGLLVMFALGLAVVFFSMDVATWVMAFISGLVMFLLMLVMYFISMRTLGFGDVKLIAVIAFIIGFTEAVQLVFLALVLTVICGLVMFVLHKASMRTELPMVPYIFVALLINMLAAFIAN